MRKFDHFLLQQSRRAELTSFCPRDFGQFKQEVMRTYDTLDSLADDAGAGTDIRRYLSCRGIKAVPTLALVAKTEDELHKFLLDPLFAGFTDGTYTIRVQEHEQPIAKAILTHMWSMARSSWSQTIAATPPTTMAPMTPASHTGGTSAGAATVEPKAPKTLPAGVWSSLVQQYQKVQLGGHDRIFPVHELIGAESALARMHHELTVSSQYTPVLLGEVLQKRSFNAAGEVNPLQKSPKKTSALTMDEDHQLIQTEDPVWNPRSMLTVLDGITSVKWAMVLVQWGEERDVIAFCDWMTQKARSRPQKSEQFVAYWQATGWHLAMAMRAGTTFKEATSAIMKDIDRFNEHMAKDPVVEKRKVPPHEITIPGKGKNSKGAKDKGKGHLRWQPYPPRERWNAAPNWNSSQQQSWWQKSPHGGSSQSSEQHGWEKTQK